MTNKNIKIAEISKDGWLGGFAKCLQCNHVWVTAIEVKVGQWWFECPHCKSMKGYFVYPVERDCEHWVCECGSQIFHLTRYGPYCVVCGIWHDEYVESVEK